MSHSRPHLRHGQPIWLRHTPRVEQRYPSLARAEHADLAVVGGGMTGGLVAQVFSEAGISVALLESGLVGAGSTAASSALLLKEPDIGLFELEQRYGRRMSRRLWQMSHGAVSQLVSLLKRLRVSCALAHRDAIYYATNLEAVEQLRREYDTRRSAGFGGRWVNPGQLRRMTGIPGRGAVQTHGSVQFDPYRACLGVLRAAARSGARIFEHSAVTRIDSRGDRVRVRTRSGMVEAQRVVIATGYATPYFRPLAGRFRMFRTYVLATEPMNASQRAELGLSDLMVWDTDRPYHYARWSPDHRLLLGGADRPVRAGQRRDLQFRLATRELRDYFEALLPALTTIEIEAAWEGLFAMTPDSFPYIGPHRRYPRHWFALGYGGNGMTFGFLAARLLLERWQGAMSPDHRLFAFDRIERS
jgi:glycine/D-amino acid oxidase-like deaminating enzyme